VVHDRSSAAEFTNYGGPHWVIDNYRLFNYLSDFAENWLKGVYMYQDDTCEIISQSDHSFNGYGPKSKCSTYVYHWMRLIRFQYENLLTQNLIAQYTILS